MAKRTRTIARPTDQPTAGSAAAPGEVGPRQPCPCGSGKRYKACHGAPGGGDIFVARPFEGLPGECDLVALRELVPAATATLTVRLPGSDVDQDVRLCSLLPMAAPAMVRDSGEVWLGLQVQHHYGDPSRDLAAVLEQALAARAADEPGIIGLLEAPGPGPRLQDLLVSPAPDEPLGVSVEDGFGFWLSDVEATDETAAALAQADEAATPTARLASVEAAYWTDVGTKEHLRWVMPHPEDRLLDALARLHEAGADELVEGGRLVGMFRAHGLLVPVWDLPLGTGAAVLEEPAAAYAVALDAALADDTPLTPAQRAARSGLATRQVTIR